MDEIKFLSDINKLKNAAQKSQTALIQIEKRIKRLESENINLRQEVQKLQNKNR